MIRVEHLYKTYNEGRRNETKVLKDVTLELPKTGLVCLLGESGSGKTTLLNAIGGLDTFSGGQITIGETTIDRYAPKIMEPIRNEHFDYIFQNYYLLGEHTVGYNVRLALNRYDLADEEKDARVDYVLEMLGMKKYKKKQVSKLSGGQKQRVSIARALVKSPDVILADEPTGNLDEENTLRTMSILKRISKDCLVLLVTHERRIARFFADRIIEICDGRVISDESNHVGDGYERGDDANIYLKELKEASLVGEGGRVHLYTPEQKEETIELSIALCDGKIYIKNHGTEDIVVEGEESGVRMVNETRPKFDLEDVEKVSYHLPKLPRPRHAALPFREVWQMAVRNLRSIGKSQVFVFAVLVVTAILLAVTAADFVNTISIDEESIVTTDAHYISLDFAKVSSLRDDASQQAILTYAWEHLDENPYGTVFAVPKENLFLRGDGYAQMEGILERISGFSYVDKKYLKEGDLLYGSMPEKREEVVIDIRILRQMIQAGGSLSTMLAEPKNFVGADLLVATTNVNLRIVGVCDTGSSNIYCGQNILLAFPVRGEKIANPEELCREYPNEYQELKLNEGELLIREGLFKSLRYKLGDKITIGDDKTHEYTIVGTCPDEMGIDYVLSEEGCRNVRDLVIYELKYCMFYANDVKNALSYFEETKEAYKKEFKLAAAIEYEAQLEAYKEAHTVDLDAKYLIAAICTILSLVMVYFTVKSNAVARSEELTVYRLLGITKGSILKAYVIEMLLMTSMTSLPSVLAVSLVLKVIAKIPSLQMKLLFPWPAVGGLLVGIYLIHALISILPVYGILSQPPAALAVKD